MISVTSLRKTYGSRTVVHDLTFDVAAGREAEAVGAPVAVHEPFEVAPIPGRDLRVEHGADF